MRDYETAFFWLADAMIVNMAYNTTEPSIGLGMNTDDTTLKCYMADTGLLISHAFNENTIVSENLYNKLLVDKLEFNGGMIVENIVAQMLVATGHKCYVRQGISCISFPNIVRMMPKKGWNWIS